VSDDADDNDDDDHDHDDDCYHHVRYHEVVGNKHCPIADTWWQTETGAVMIAPLPVRGWGQKPGSATMPFFGVQPALLTAEGKVMMIPNFAFNLVVYTSF
jgi:acetyl-CoA synthetase